VADLLSSIAAHWPVATASPTVVMALAICTTTPRATTAAQPPPCCWAFTPWPRPPWRPISLATTS
jgi:hypothetical protein